MPGFPITDGQGNLTPIAPAIVLGALLINLLRERLGIELPVAALFEAPTVAGLARRRAEEAGVLPPDVGVAGLRRLLRVFAANLDALGRYAPAPTPVPALLFRAAHRPGPDPAPGWRHLLGPGLDAEPFPGDHYSLLREPLVAGLATRLRGRLARRGRTAHRPPEAQSGRQHAAGR